MSQNSKFNRSQRDVQQEKEGKNIVLWIIGVLIGLGVLYTLYIGLNL